VKAQPELIANPRNRDSFVVFGDPGRYYAAVEAPPFPDLCTCQSPPCWYKEGLDDSNWLQEDYTRIGYGQPEIVTEMPEGTRTLYLGRNFTIQDHPELFQELVLYVWYDDGFVAYLKGQEVARTGLDPEPCWDAGASAHERGSRPQESHKHWYERTYPINKYYEVACQEENHYVDPEGRIYVTVGGGGARANSGDCTCTAWSPKLITHVDGYSACYVHFYHTPTHVVACVRAYRVNNTGGAFLIDEFRISKSSVAFRRGMS